MPRLELTTSPANAAQAAGARAMVRTDLPLDLAYQS